jgi:hypothetical protein
MWRRRKSKEGWRKFHCREFRNIYLPNIIMAIKSRRMRWASHVGCMRGVRNEKKKNNGLKTPRRKR